MAGAEGDVHQAEASNGFVEEAEHECRCFMQKSARGVQVFFGILQSTGV